MRVIDAGAATMRRNDSTVTSRAEGHQANLDRNYLLFFIPARAFRAGAFFIDGPTGAGHDDGVLFQ
jgi:hypothetical protein